MSYALLNLYRWCGFCVVLVFASGNLRAQNPAVIVAGSYTITFSFAQHPTIPTQWRCRIQAASTNWPGWINIAFGGANGLTDINNWGAAGGNSFDTNNRADKYSPYFTPTNELYVWTATLQQNSPSASGSGPVGLFAPVNKSVTVQVENEDDRPWQLTFEGEQGARFTTISAGASGQLVLEEDELPEEGRRGRLVTDRKLNELHSDGSWYYAGGQMRDPTDPANDIYTYEIGFEWGPISKGDAKDPSNVFSITIPLYTARDIKYSAVIVTSDNWEIPQPTPEQPAPAPPAVKPPSTTGPRPTAELAKSVYNTLQQTIDPATGQTRLEGYFGPVVRNNTPSTLDGAAIVETLDEMQARAEKLHQLSTLQGEDAAAVAKGTKEAAQAGKAAVEGIGPGGTGGMGEQGAAAGAEAADLFPDSPTGLPYSPGGGSAPNFVVTLPSSFGGGSFDLNPFSSDRLGEVASWFRSAVAWLAIVSLGGWVWSQLGDWVRGISMLPQAKGNTLVAGTGAQATALVAAGLMTTAIVVAITAILSWSFGELTIPTLISTALSNPVGAMPAGALWMLDQIFPVGTLVVCLVAKLSFNIYAAGLFATCAAVIRFIVP